MGRQMVMLNEIDSFFIGGTIVKMGRKIRQYYEFESCFVVRLGEQDKNNSIPALLAYNYADKNFSIRWNFPHNQIIGVSPVRIAQLDKRDFFYQYQKNHEDMELLEVYAGEFRYLVDADTGNILKKIDSR
jgi:hypothetical protein